ncbi:MAG: YgfZ/GcvT domain-containing protein [Aquificaceae bacterium]
MQWAKLERSKIRVYGKKGNVLPKGIEEHSSFLHGLFSNDIRGMKDKSMLYSLWLRQNGSPIEDFFIYKMEGEYILDTQMHAQKLIEEFQRLKLSLRVYFEDLTGKLDHFFVFGDGSEDFVRRTFGLELKEGEAEKMDGTTVAKNSIRLREEGYDIIVEKGKLEGILKEEESMSLQEWEDLRIERLVPKIHKELREGFSPLESGVLPFGVSLTKGCYVGQEAIARVYYRGRTPRTLAKFEVKSVKEGDRIRDEEKDVGVITSVNSKGSLALGYILREKAKLGKEYGCGEGKAILIQTIQ